MKSSSRMRDESESFDASTPSVRSISPTRLRAAWAGNGWLSKNSACWGTTVSDRLGLCISGLAKSKFCRVIGKYWRSMVV